MFRTKNNALSDVLPEEHNHSSASTLPFDAKASEVNHETATFGLGWFWGPDSQFGSINGVLRTRSGYCGGDLLNPNYQNIGDHTEAVSIDYDPTIITYEDLLARFWRSIRCESNSSNKQYMKAIFFRDEEQQKLALKSLIEHAEKMGLTQKEVATHILPVNTFTYAENYHQNYLLTRQYELRGFLEETYPSIEEFADSAVASRLNAYLGSGMSLDWKQFSEELTSYGLPSGIEQAINAQIQSKL